MSSEDEHIHFGITSTFDRVKIVWSLFLVTFSVIVVLANIAAENTKFAAEIHPAFAGVLLWVLIIWMTMVEGGQCSMVGLPPIDRELYRESHPITYKITGWGHKGDNLDRYLMGRQFMVIFLNFTISLCGGTINPDVDVLGLPGWVKSIFLGSGIAMVLQNVTIGQLTSQISASHCMLDYINTHFMTFTYWVTVVIEFTGVMHISYFIRTMSYWAAGKPVASNEPPMQGATMAFYWLRVIFSAGCLGMALAVTIDALFRGQTALWGGVPQWAGLVLFFVLMTCVGLLEGMQIAFFAVSKLPKSERGDSNMALKTCHCLFKNGGKNLPGFMCGRQVTVTLCFFVIARVTTITVDIGVDENIFGVSDWVQTMFNLGFMGALTTTILGSIAWQLVAGAFPIAFLSNPIVYIFLQIALFIEALGFTAAAWMLSVAQSKIMGFQFDEVYVGTAEERAAKGHADDTEADQGNVGTVIIAHNVGERNMNNDFMDLIQTEYSKQREQVMEHISILREKIKESADNVEVRKAYEFALRLQIDSLKSVNQRQTESVRNLSLLLGDDDDDDDAPVAKDIESVGSDDI